MRVLLGLIGIYFRIYFLEQLMVFAVVLFGVLLMAGAIEWLFP